MPYLCCQGTRKRNICLTQDALVGGGVLTLIYWIHPKKEAWLNIEHNGENVLFELLGLNSTPDALAFSSCGVFSPCRTTLGIPPLPSPKWIFVDYCDFGVLIFCLFHLRPYVPYGLICPSLLIPECGINSRLYFKIHKPTSQLSHLVLARLTSSLLLLSK